MAVDREALVIALVERLEEKMTTIVYWSRRAKAPGEVQLQPALLVLQGDQVPDVTPGLPPFWDIEIELVALVRCAQDDESPDTQINAIVKEIEEALTLQANETQPLEGGDELGTTLDGAAVWCRITGTVERVAGETSGQGVAVVPVTIRAWQ